MVYAKSPLFLALGFCCAAQGTATGAEQEIRSILMNPSSDLPSVLSVLGTVTYKAPFELGEVLFSDEFESDLYQWTAEIREPGSVSIRDGAMEIDVTKGCTVWFEEKLSGPVLIEFEIRGVDEGGPNDSVNDMNIFWMAKDPACPENIFHPGHNRRGDFSDYHHLRLYYVGHGKDYSTGVGRVRFRRYPGDGTRPLLPEHVLDDNKYKILGNSVRTVQLVACDGIIQYISNGEVVYDFRDPLPYTDGWFAFRTVHSHLIIDNFRAYRLVSQQDRSEGSSGGQINPLADTSSRYALTPAAVARSH